MLIYAKGGAAWAEVDYAVAVVTTAGGAVVLGPAFINDRRLGWTVGGGIEFGITPNWSAKIEYNYLNFGAEQYTFIAPGAALTSSSEIQMHLVKGGISYRFGLVR
jgi:outer membrane immunogenic protein